MRVARGRHISFLVMLACTVSARTVALAQTEQRGICQTTGDPTTINTSSYIVPTDPPDSEFATVFFTVSNLVLAPNQLPLDWGVFYTVPRVPTTFPLGTHRKIFAWKDAEVLAECWDIVYDYGGIVFREHQIRPIDASGEAYLLKQLSDLDGCSSGDGSGGYATSRSPGQPWTRPSFVIDSGTCGTPTSGGGDDVPVEDVEYWYTDPVDDLGGEYYTCYGELHFDADWNYLGLTWDYCEAEI